MNAIPVWPEQASNFAHEMDLLYIVLLGLTAFFSVIVFVPIVIMVSKYRLGTKADRSHPHHHNLPLELAWTIIPFLMGIPVFLWASKLFVDMYTPIDAKNSLEISVVGKQWMWHLQHPTGQRENNELHIPLGRPVKLMMVSQDVIHAFYIPAFRIKKDVLPGTYHTQWFIPTKVGKYHIFCAEFCGTKHSEMTGSVWVMEPEDYEKWLKDEQWGINKLTRSTSMKVAGEQLFTELGCVACHGKKDDPKNVSLARIFGTQRMLSDGRRVVADEDYIRRSIYEPDAMKVEGHEPIMPSFRGRVDEQQVLQVIAYIKSLNRDEPRTGSAQ
ncbi:MAG: cytochrome c oxidase subunit II [Fimbriimonadales bacterium]